jgi:hypothetical protein
MPRGQGVTKARGVDPGVDRATALPREATFSFRFTVTGCGPGWVLVRASVSHYGGQSDPCDCVSRARQAYRLLGVRATWHIFGLFHHGARRSLVVMLVVV